VWWLKKQNNYQKNYQGDIEGIYDSSYKLIVKYSYDAYGNVLSIEDNEGKEITDNNHIGRLNPYRYRSYYYDEETNLYYLKSRYYNPLWGRFINADGIIGENQYINLYLYAKNNPIINLDSEGNFFISLINKIESKVTGIVNTVSKRFTNVINQSITNSNNSTKVTGNKNKMPTKSKPNSKKKNPNGDIRIYGPDGRVVKDIDSSHPSHHPELKNPHQHDWIWEGEKPTRGPAHNIVTGEDIATGALIIGGGYLVYRGIRMLPSLIPAMWWTIPINAATP